MFGAGGGTCSYEEAEHADLLVMWGSNAREAHPIFFHHVLKGLRNGARYRFRVDAINALGSGPRSRLSRAAVPESWLISFGWCSPLFSPYI